MLTLLHGLRRFDLRLLFVWYRAIFIVLCLHVIIIYVMFIYFCFMLFMSDYSSCRYCYLLTLPDVKYILSYLIVYTCLCHFTITDFSFIEDAYLCFLDQNKSSRRIQMEACYVLFLVGARTSVILITDVFLYACRCLLYDIFKYSQTRNEVYIMWCDMTRYSSVRYECLRFRFFLYSTNATNDQHFHDRD